MDIHYNTTGISPACLLDKFRAHIHLLKPLFFLFFSQFGCKSNHCCSKCWVQKRETRLCFLSLATNLPQSSNHQKKAQTPKLWPGKGHSPSFLGLQHTARKRHRNKNWEIFSLCWIKPCENPEYTGGGKHMGRGKFGRVRLDPKFNFLC